jgi:heat shock protein HtpX
MKYVGMHSQIQRNNFYSGLLLISFPLIILAVVWCFLAVFNYLSHGDFNAEGEFMGYFDVQATNDTFLQALPWVVGIVGIWFTIAYFANASMVKAAVGSRPLSRMENPRVYNIVENLCMTCGMDMPKINIVDDPQLNAFASGINKQSYTVTVTTGLLEVLNDDELAGVIGHELTHIRNKDTRLLITSIVFVGIISTIMTVIVRMLFNSMIYGGENRSRSRNRDDNKNGAAGIVIVLLVAVVCCAIAYLFTVLTRFAISRKREYMADAGGAELCGNPLALASALRKISKNPGLDNVNREDVAQLFIMHPDEMKTGIMGFVNSLFSTHPDPEKRIAILEQF